MTKRTRCLASVLVLFSGLISLATAFASAGETNGVTRGLVRSKATTARFSPGLPSSRPDEFTTVPDLRSIHFDFDKANIHRAEAKLLDMNAQWLKSNPSQDILIEAYADERGSVEYNLALAERRAKAVRNELVARGVNPNRITTAGYGEVRPACTRKTEACWSLSRRVDILIKQLSLQVPSS